MLIGGSEYYLFNLRLHVILTGNILKLSSEVVTSAASLGFISPEASFLSLNTNFSRIGVTTVVITTIITNRTEKSAAHKAHIKTLIRNYQRNFATGNHSHADLQSLFVCVSAYLRTNPQPTTFDSIATTSSTTANMIIVGVIFVSVTLRPMLAKKIGDNSR